MVNKYNRMLSSSVTSDLASTYAPIDRWETKIVSSMFEKSELTTFEKEEIRLEIADVSLVNYGITPRTQKLLDSLMLVFGTQNNYGEQDNLNLQVTLSLDDYIALLGRSASKSTKDKVRREVEQDLELLYQLSIRWIGDSKRRRGFQDTRVIADKGIVNGNISATFSPKFAKYVNSKQVIEYPLQLLKINTRRPLNYYLGRKLATHYSMSTNRNKGTHNIIKVQTLLDAVEGTLPTYERVMEELNRSPKQHIITPFEKALNQLQDDKIITWQYTGSKHQTLDKDTLNNNDYNIFINKMVSFELLDYPPSEKD